MGPNDPFSMGSRGEPGPAPGDPERLGQAPAAAPLTDAARPVFGWRLLVGFVVGLVFGALVLVLGMDRVMTLLVWGTAGIIMAALVTVLLRFDVVGAIRAGWDRSSLGPRERKGS